MEFHANIIIPCNTGHTAPRCATACQVRHEFPTHARTRRPQPNRRHAENSHQRGALERERRRTRTTGTAGCWRPHQPNASLPSSAAHRSVFLVSRVSFYELVLFYSFVLLSFFFVHFFAPFVFSHYADSKHSERLRLCHGVCMCVMIVCFESLRGCCKPVRWQRRNFPLLPSHSPPKHTLSLSLSLLCCVINCNVLAWRFRTSRFSHLRHNCCRTHHHHYLTR